MPWIVTLVATMALASPAVPGPVKRDRPLPEVSWLDVQGDTLTWRDLGEKNPIVLVFWATWCRTCKKTWPALADLAEKHAGSPGAPTWASISVGEEADRVARVARDSRLPGRVLVDPDQRGARALGISHVPTVCVLRGDGTVAYFGDPRISRLDRLLSTMCEEQPAKED